MLTKPLMMMRLRMSSRTFAMDIKVWHMETNIADAASTWSRAAPST